MFRQLHFAGLFNAWVGKKHLLLTKNMLFYKSAKQNVRQTDKKAGKKRSKGLKNWHKMVKCVPLCSHQSFLLEIRAFAPDFLFCVANYRCG